MTDKAQHSNIANGFAGITALAQWRALPAFIRNGLALKFERNGDLAAAVQLLMRQESPERCAEMARVILERPDVRFLESVLHEQLVEAERDARAKDL
jgi:hypothetical protein